MRRIDLRLLPILGALYSIALIDRTNISAARISGMDEDLELYIGNRYTIALVVFFPPYFLFELPSNIVLRKVGSANWLAFIAFSWGCVMIGQGFAPNYSALAGCRTMLGLFEAGFFPGCKLRVKHSSSQASTTANDAILELTLTCNFYINRCLLDQLLVCPLRGPTKIGVVLPRLCDGRWLFLHPGVRPHPNGRSRRCSRMAVDLRMSTVPPATHVLLTLQTQIIEGLLTCTIAVAAWFIIIDFPDKAHRKGLLTQHEASAIKQRIDQDRNDAVPDPLTWSKFFMHLGDFKLWVFALMFMVSMENTTVP